MTTMQSIGRRQLIIGIVVVMSALGASAWAVYQVLLRSQMSPSSIPVGQLGDSSQPGGAVSSPTTSSSISQSPTPTKFIFSDPKKSAHYVTNQPTHGSILATVPSEVSILFNFTLSPSSTITIQKDGQEYGVGLTTVSSDKLRLTKILDSAAPNGLYTVNYSACWPDGSCHTGSFQFALNH